MISHRAAEGKRWLVYKARVGWVAQWDFCCPEQDQCTCGLGQTVFATYTRAVEHTQRMDARARKAGELYDLAYEDV